MAFGRNWRSEQRRTLQHRKGTAPMVSSSRPGFVLDVSTFGPLAKIFQGQPMAEELSAGIEPEPKPPPPVGRAPAAASHKPPRRDPLASTLVPEDEAVKRINSAFFVNRSSGTIYHHGTEGDPTAFKSQQQFKTALGGRMANTITPKGIQSRPAADVWLASPNRLEVTACNIAPTASASNRTI